MDQEVAGVCSYFTLARQALKNHWLMAALITFLLAAIPSAVDAFLQTVLGITLPIFYYAVTLFSFMGVVQFYLGIAQNDFKVDKLWSHFSNVNLLIQSIILYIVQTLVIAFGFFLLIVPGVILLCMLSMSGYILAQNPQITFIEAMKRSAKMTKGKKCKILLMYLSSIGFIILGLLCLIVGVFFAIPMCSTAFAIFYLRNKGGANPLIPENNDNIV